MFRTLTKYSLHYILTDKVYIYFVSHPALNVIGSNRRIVETKCDGKCDVCKDYDECAEGKKRILEDEGLLKIRMSKIRRKIAVISGKGGVGKSITTANLAVALASQNPPLKVGILDVDLHGPSIPKMLGMKRQRLKAGPPGVFPATGPLGIRVASMDLLLPGDETPVIWRGPLKMSAVRQFLSEIVWGRLDFLLIDLPPGTGDESLSIMQLLPEMDGVLIVTIPSEVSQMVVKKAVTFTRQLKIPIIGIIENMSGFTCPRCNSELDVFKIGGGEKIAHEMNVQFLGRIPLDPRICGDSDSGKPFIIEHADTPAARSFMNIVNNIKTYLNNIKG
ncbi:MAG: Mrp/NBP35 family ATP-binding protein [Candidatus Bathyarchaeia archaeon]